MLLHRREFSRLALGSAAFGLTGGSRAHCMADGFAGDRLYADVVTYAAMGDHRTGAKADNQSTVWLGDRLRQSGYKIETPSFVTPLFEPHQAELVIGDLTVEGFPAWPVVPTQGISAPLRDSTAVGDLTGVIALVVLPYRPGAAFIVRGYGSAVLDAQTRGAAAVAIVTQGPTGEIVALNAHLERYAWRVPVIQIAGREAERLSDLARIGTSAQIRITGKLTPAARAMNVVATRPALPGAPSGTVVLTTPKSGWFTCAGERGSGIAIFLAIADAMIKATRRQIVAVCTSGHELEGLGGEALLKYHAPAPADVAIWTHIGANIASNVVDLNNGLRRTEAIHSQRGILVPADKMSTARAAFLGQPGYEDPIDLMSDRAVGEVVIYRRDGHRRLVGIVGGHPLHHTRLDIPSHATSPNALEPVARGLAEFILPIAAA